MDKQSQSQAHVIELLIEHNFSQVHKTKKFTKKINHDKTKQR